MVDIRKLITLFSVPAFLFCALSPLLATPISGELFYLTE